MAEVISTSGHSSTASVEEAARRPTLEYVIYSTADGSTRAGGTERLDIGKLGTSYRIFISKNSERRYSASVYREGGPACMEPDGVEIVALNPSGTEIDAIALEQRQEQGRTTWIGTVNAAENATIQTIRIAVVVAGERYEHEVSSNP